MILPFALLLAVQAAEASPQSAADSAMAANCNARMVEIPVTVTSRGLPRQTKVKICGKVGQSDADWAVTLKDALSKVEANPRMPAELKEQIVTGLRLEIARLPAANAEAGPPPQASPAPTIVPVASAPPPVVARPPIDTGRVEYSTYAPLPAPKVAPGPTTLAAAVAMAPPPLPAPKLTFHCQSTENPGLDGSCDLLERETLVTIRADEDVPAGTSLAFLRRGDKRAEVDLAPLRRGQSQRFILPARVCQGVTGSRVEIQVVRAAGKSTQVVDTRGPYDLRC